MQLYFIRHAQSVNNALWKQAGDYSNRSEDPELTKTGRRQAEILASFLSQGKNIYFQGNGDFQKSRGFGLTHLYTSLMVRAIATGTSVAHALGSPLIAWPDLHEGGGIYLYDEESGEPVGLPGNGRSYFQTHYPNLVLPDGLDDRGWWNRPYETRPERRARARRFLIELLEQHGNTDHRVAVFSHGGFYNHFLAVLLNLVDFDAKPSQTAIEAMNGENVILSTETEIWFEMNNAAITRIDFTSNEVKLIYQNRVDFLPRRLIT